MANKIEKNYPGLITECDCLEETERLEARKKVKKKTGRPPTIKHTPDEVRKMVRQYGTNKEVAGILGVSPTAIGTFLKNGSSGKFVENTKIG
jgi:hypothetical protein